jgi:hypothetical protein
MEEIEDCINAVVEGVFPDYPGNDWRKRHLRNDLHKLAKAIIEEARKPDAIAPVTPHLYQKP